MAGPVRARLTPAEGRRFGLTLGGAFTVLAAILAWRGHDPIALPAGAIGVLVLLGALVAPSRLGPVQRGWMAFGERLSRITTPIFLGIIFFGVITPVGLLRRWIGSNPLKHAAADGSYLVPREPGRGRSDLTRQF